MDSTSSSSRYPTKFPSRRRYRTVCEDEQSVGGDGRSKGWNSEDDERKTESDVEEVKKRKRRGLMQRVGGMLIGMAGGDSGDMPVVSGGDVGRRASKVYEYLGEEDAFDLMFDIGGDSGYGNSADKNKENNVAEKHVSTLEFNIKNGPLIPAHCGAGQTAESTADMNNDKLSNGVKKNVDRDANNNGDGSVCDSVRDKNDVSPSYKSMQEKELRLRLEECGVGCVINKDVYLSKALCDKDRMNTGIDTVDSGETAAKVLTHPFGGIERATAGFRNEVVRQQIARRRMSLYSSDVYNQNGGRNAIRSRANSIKKRSGKNSSGFRSRSNTLTRPNNNINVNVNSYNVDDEDYDSDSSFYSIYSYHDDVVDADGRRRSSLDSEYEWQPEFINKCQLPGADGFWDCDADDWYNDNSSLVFSDPLDPGDSVDPTDVNFYEPETCESLPLPPPSSSSSSPLSLVTPSYQSPLSPITSTSSSSSLPPLSLSIDTAAAAESFSKPVPIPSSSIAFDDKESKSSSSSLPSTTTNPFLQRPPPPPPPSPRFDRLYLSYPHLPSSFMSQTPSSNISKDDSGVPIISLFDRSLNFCLFEVD